MNSMSTQNGNDLVDRIIQAAVDLHVFCGATDEEQHQFVTRKLEELATSCDYADAIDYHVFTEAHIATRALTEQTYIS